MSGHYTRRKQNEVIPCDIASLYLQNRVQPLCDNGEERDQRLRIQAADRSVADLFQRDPYTPIAPFTPNPSNYITPPLVEDLFEQKDHSAEFFKKLHQTQQLR